MNTGITFTALKCVSWIFGVCISMSSLPAKSNLT